MSELSKNIDPQCSSLSYSSNRYVDEIKSQNPQTINKHVIALLTFLALLPLVYFIPDVVGQFMPAIKWLNVVVSVGIIVPIISYIVIPAAHLFLSRGK